MNTIKNKAKFFAQYLGIEVEYPDIDNKLIKARLENVGFDEIMTTYKRKRNGVSGDYLAFKKNNSHNANAFNTMLLLKPLSSISDEDAIGVAEIVYAKSENWSSSMISVHNGLGFIENTIDSDEDSFSVFGINNPASKLSQVLDYLRSKGYALPYNGISVDEQIEFGWIKLKS